MGDRWLGPDDVVPFVDATQQDVAEVNGPDAVGDLLEADGMLLERVGEEEQALLQADGAGVGDALDEEMARVLDGRQGARVDPGRGAVARCRRPVLQRLVGPLIVVEPAEGVEGALLGRERRAGLSRRSETLPVMLLSN